MELIKSLRRLERLSAGAEEHGVDDAKGRMKTADRIVQQGGVMGQRDRNPRVSQLQQRCAPRTEKDGGLAIDSPGDGSGAKETTGCLARQAFQ